MRIPKVFIVILNWNGKKDTFTCLSSLKKITYNNYKVVVVDNGSTDGSTSAIREHFPEVTLLETGKNLGYAGGNNVGMSYSLDKNADYILLLNNDTVVDPEILNHFIEAFQRNPKIGILGGKIYLFDHTRMFDHFGGKWNSRKGHFDFIGWREIDDGKTWEEMQEIDYVCGAALMVKKEVIQKIGFLEPRFFLFWEESDYCFRARRENFAVMICPKAKLWHKGSASFSGGKTHATYFQWRNRFLWIERNCAFWEKLFLFVSLSFSVLNLMKLIFIKRLQLLFSGPFQSAEKLKKRKERILRYKAAIQGGRDYLFRKFGDGPAWIYQQSDFSD